MEMGRGEWTDKDTDLLGLLHRFLDHMSRYERIFVLRAFAPKKVADKWKYELLEIPKSLLFEAPNGKLEMRHDSTQMPKPGYCTVVDNNGVTKYKLYFDGGTERKLQVVRLRAALCVCHVTWEF